MTLATAVRRRPLLAVVALAAASLGAWTGIGGFDSAGGQEKPIVVKRAYDGAYRWSPSDPVFALALGSDAHRGNPTTARFDSIHIVAIDPKSKTASLVGIPRDSYVSIAGAGRNRINAAGVFGGPERMVQTVESLSGCEFQYWMVIGFEGFRGLVDSFGGVAVDVPARMVDEFADIDLQPGRQVLDGGKALGFARSRKTAATPRGDFDRSRHQGDLMIGALSKAREMLGEDPGNMLRFLRHVLKYVETDLPTFEALRLGMLASSIDPDDVTNVVLDGRTTSIGGASVVEITSSGLDTLADVCADGRLE